MPEQPTPDERIATERRQRLVLRVAATLLTDREFDLLAERWSALSADQLREELDAVGSPLQHMPNDVWDRVMTPLALRPVPDTDPPALEAEVPLWTEHGFASRSALVRLVFEGDSDLEDPRVVGFVDRAHPDER